jgi:hypothetical protein
LLIGIFTLAVMPKAEGSRGQLVGRGIIGGSDDDPPIETLAASGIDKYLADRARKLAAIPDHQFESKISKWRDRVSQLGFRKTR